MAKDDLTGEQLELKYVPITQIQQWQRNLKRHDLGGIIESIRRHGFKDPMKFEPMLNGGDGGFVEGNGRDLAIKALYAEWVNLPDEEKPPIPGGILVDADNVWHIPVLFGVDAKSQNAAEAYGIDHNNLTLWGGDFDLSDIRKMYEPGLNDMLREIIEGGGIVANIDLDMLKSYEDFDFSEFGEPTNKDLAFRFVIDGLDRDEAEKLVEENGRGKIETYRMINEEV